MAGAAIPAVAALIAVTPFLAHLSYHPNELSERFQETSVLAPENQTRLRYLHPQLGPPRCSPFNSSAPSGCSTATKTVNGFSNS